MNLHHRLTAAVVIAAALMLTGCATGHSPADPTSGNPASSISVVASTDVYGDIARQIGGDQVTVTSIIDSPNQDPHDYEADARSQLAVSKADVVVENGGGYDDFIDTMLAALDDTSIHRLNVAEISGYDQNPDNGEFNEHLWYDFPAMQKLADRLAGTFTTLEPDAASVFQSNAAKFTQALSKLSADAGGLRSAHAGTGVLVTEPLPLYLTDAAGLVNKTAAAFSEAMEEGMDVSPIVLRDTIAELQDGSVRLLIYNEQTSGAQSEALLEAAKENAVPSVSMTETLPVDTDYLGWMQANVTALSGALEDGPSHGS